VETIDGQAHVFGDVDGDGNADFMVIVTNLPSLENTDFVL
jgi:hypothetical protein